VVRHLATQCQCCCPHSLSLVISSTDCCCLCENTPSPTTDLLRLFVASEQRQKSVGTLAQVPFTRLPLSKHYGIILSFQSIPSCDLHAGMKQTSVIMWLTIARMNSSLHNNNSGMVTTVKMLRCLSFLAIAVPRLKFPIICTVL